MESPHYYASKRCIVPVSPQKLYAASNEIKNITLENPGTSNATFSNVKKSCRRSLSSPILCEHLEVSKCRCYLPDGRIMYDGELRTSTPSEIWKQLFIRTFVKQMEDEIESPVEECSDEESNFIKAKLSSSLSLNAEQSSDTIEMLQKEKLSQSTKKPPNVCLYLLRKPNNENIKTTK
uniref:Uncharacterized protein n=1 Tax=Acrobeloides nanus TaxID=290746 RepID=A0A914DPP0_9BILA